MSNWRIGVAAPCALAWLAIAGASPAAADMTATYSAPHVSFSMKVEIDDNGDVRGQVTGQSQYFVTRGGEGFLIQTTPKGALVTRVEDVAAIMAEQWAALSPPEDLAEELPALNLIESGTATINGRTGRAYFGKGRDGKLSPGPVVVISDDPHLAPLGKAMARQFAMSNVMMAQALGEVPPFAREMQRILETGTPLLFSGAELQSVEISPIDATRFELPKRPETSDEVRARLLPTKP